MPAVAGLKDDRLGQKVVAFIRASGILDSNTLDEYCRGSDLINLKSFLSKLEIEFLLYLETSRPLHFKGPFSENVAIIKSASTFNEFFKSFI